ncbi:MAG: RsmB/NOP family class I SAM-dependent RNA methyltransferase [Betaproteobacteria bacterium]|nr:MAG: RsmB/NOP family class I SAM-dependent RNA methyltransferase [Betaproteobacteria bacterium]
MRLSRALLDSANNATALACKFDRPADTILAEFFRQNRQLGSHDRHFISDTVFSILRHKRLLEAIVPQPDLRRLVLASLLKFQGLPLNAVEAVGAPSDQAWLREVERVSTSNLPPAVRLSLPDWLWQNLQSDFGEDKALRLSEALLAPAPLDLRVNTLIANRKGVIEELTRGGITARPTAYSPIGVRLEGKPSLNQNPLYLSGAIEIQDEGSQLLGLLVAPARRQMVVDFCAGTGGKTLLLGAMMRDQGRLYAFDVSAKRLEALKQRVKRAQLANVHPQLIGSEHDPRIARLAGKVDRVLVDAPCSGLGTLRRSPDLKWRQSPASVSDWVKAQVRVLQASSQLVKPGGRLVYATCSLLAAENEEIVEAFLESQNGRFCLLNSQSVLEAQRIQLDTGHYFRVLPDEHGCDGFFAAVLERTEVA